MLWSYDHQLSRLEDGPVRDMVTNIMSRLAPALEAQLMESFLQRLNSHGKSQFHFLNDICNSTMLCYQHHHLHVICYRKREGATTVCRSGRMCRAGTPAGQPCPW